MRGLTLPSRALPRCPTCKHGVSWEGNPHRPFCSLTCRLVDLGVWLDGGYRVPGAETGFPKDSTSNEA